MAGCVASTSTVTTNIDGAGTLRSSAIIAPGGNQPLVAQADGLAVRPTRGIYGWPLNGDDTYAVPAGVASVFGPVIYGPEVQAQVQTVAVGWVIARINWEVQAGWTGTNTFSGLAFELQYSFDHTNWGAVATASYYQPISLTVLHHFSTDWPISFNDNGLHNFWVRLQVSAGAFGTGDTGTIQFSRRRSITMMY